MTNFLFRLWWLGLVFSAAFAVFAAYTAVDGGGERTINHFIEAIMCLGLIPLCYVLTTRTLYWLFTGR